MNIKKIYNSFVDVMFPNNVKCIACKREINSTNNNFCLCEKCFSKLETISGKVCLKCGEPLFSEANYCLRCKRSTFNFVRAYSFCSYRGLARKLIQDFKFNNKPYFKFSLSNMLYVTYLLNILPHYKINMVTYVPIHSTRLSERGYNQCELLSQEFCRKSGLRLYKNVLIKVALTRHQVGLNTKERKVNLKNAFKVTDKKVVKDKTVLLIDDIFTTGSTVDECASMLMRAGAYKVVVLTIAHTELNRAIIKVDKKWKLSRLFQTNHFVTHT